MDTQKSTREPQYAQHDDAYSPNDDAYHDAASMIQKDAERALEREISRQEYETDRDAILLAIKDALKEHRYQEAQEFIYKYRVAAKTDESFTMLANMTKQGLENAKKIEKIELALDATPDDDYDVRMALCQKILKIQPNREPTITEMNRCRAAKGLDPLNSHGKAPLVSQKVQIGIKKGVSYVALSAFLSITFVELIIFGLVLGSGVASLIILVEGTLHGVTLLSKGAAQSPESLIKRILLNAVLFVAILALNITLYALLY